MKWYTLEERPIKKYEYGLFWTKYDSFYYCGLEQSAYNEDFVLYPLVDVKCCNKDIDNVPVADIKYWIPLEELKLTLPKDKQ